MDPTVRIFKFDTLHAGVLTIDRDTWDLTIGDLVFEGATFRPQGTKSEEEDAAVLLGFYSAYAESARRERDHPGHIEREYGPDWFTAEQWAALDEVGEDMFWTWANELAPTCATGCSAVAIVEDSEGSPICAQCLPGRGAP